MPGFPGIKERHPAAGRLLLRAVDRRTGEIVAVGGFALDAGKGEFGATLHLPDGTTDTLVIDIYDSLGRGSARHSDLDARDIDGLSRAQLSFTLVRESLAARSLGDAGSATTTLQFARMALGDVAAPGVDYGNAIDAAITDPRAVPGLTNPVEPQRPLLCELAQALRRAVER